MMIFDYFLLIILKIKHLPNIPLSLRRQIATSQISIFFQCIVELVKFFNESKGFGFVVDNSSKEEIFVHISGLVDMIVKVTKLLSTPNVAKKGMNAVNVKVA